MSTIKQNKTKNKITRKNRKNKDKGKDKGKDKDKKIEKSQRIIKVKRVNQTKLANLVNAIKIKDKCKAVGLSLIEQYTEKNLKDNDKLKKIFVNTLYSKFAMNIQPNDDFYTYINYLWIKNNVIASHLNLPPVKLHCSLLAEDSIKSAVENYKQKFPNNKNMMGGFKSMEEMCRDYLFTIAIENTSHDYYFTEKIINPLINNTVPLYWGCKRVEEYFPKHTIRLTGNITRDVIIIHSVLRNPNKYIAEYKIDQEMVLNKVNLVKNIERIFEV